MYTNYFKNIGKEVFLGILLILSAIGKRHFVFLN